MMTKMQHLLLQWNSKG